MPLLVSLTGERAIYLALELDRSWTETVLGQRRRARQTDSSLYKDLGVSYRMK